jgi:hypothetical protein
VSFVQTLGSHHVKPFSDFSLLPGGQSLAAFDGDVVNHEKANAAPTSTRFMRSLRFMRASYSS